MKKLLSMLMVASIFIKIKLVRLQIYYNILEVITFLDKLCITILLQL